MNNKSRRIELPLNTATKIALKARTTGPSQAHLVMQDVKKALEGGKTLTLWGFHRLVETHGMPSISSNLSRSKHHVRNYPVSLGWCEAMLRDHLDVLHKAPPSPEK